MFNITKSVINDNLIETVNARDVWTNLDSKRDFSNWFSRHTSNPSFVENQDYVLLNNADVVNSGRGRPEINYAVSLDMAKHMAMMDYSESGHKVRQYFIDFENNVSKIERTPTALLPTDIARSSYEALMFIARDAGVPESYALQVVAQEVTRQSGVDVTKLLTQAAAMNNVPDEDVMLEPTALADYLEVTAIKLNKLLASKGLQEKVAGHWLPTALGKSLSTRHAWSTKFNSGYNLKWKAKETLAILDHKGVT